MQTAAPTSAGITLEERTCECGDDCGIKFRCMPTSQQRVAAICLERQSLGIKMTKQEAVAKAKRGFAGNKYRKHSPIVDGIIHAWNTTALSRHEIAEQFKCSYQTVYKYTRYERKTIYVDEPKTPNKEKLREIGAFDPIILKQDPLKVVPDPKRDRTDQTRQAPRSLGDYETEWNRCVKAARERILSINKKRMEVAELAISVCDTTHGGSRWHPEQFRSLKQFADECGVNYKTLNTWVRVKKYVYDKLRPDVWDERNYAAAIRTLEKIGKGGADRKTTDQVTDPYNEEKKRSGSPQMLRNVTRRIMAARTDVSKISPDECEPSELRDALEASKSVTEEIARLLNHNPDQDVKTIVHMGRGFEFDFDKLMATRLLIQGNSGSGKSHAIRRFIESIYGNVPVVIFDPENEFHTLSEKFEFKVVDCDSMAEEMAHAAAVEKKSIVIQMQDAGAEQKLTYCRDFLNTLTNYPRELWTKMVIVIDEAHLFAPVMCVKGLESVLDAVRDIASRGRKRGYCLVMATQRLAKLNKTVSAELTNKMVGRTVDLADMKRIVTEMSQCKSKYQTYRNLKPGEFYCLGPAISDTPVKHVVGAVETTHL